MSRLTVCVTCVWAGVDSAWEQEKLEARKMPVNRAESPASGAPEQERDSCNQAETAIGKVYCKEADTKPNKSNGEQELPRCTMVANHNDVTNGGERQDPDEEAIEKK